MSGTNPIPALIGIAALVVLFLIPLVVTGLKGKFGLLALGLVIHPCWWVAAIRLAKPNSWWARNLYNGDKLALSRSRFLTLKDVRTAQQPQP